MVIQGILFSDFRHSIILGKQIYENETKEYKKSLQVIVLSIACKDV
jgi:hypothetical protein